MYLLESEIRYTSVRVASHVAAQHRQVLEAQTKRELVISWTLPLLQQFTKLADIAHEELAILRLLISVLRDAVRTGGSVGGIDAWRTPLPDDVASWDASAFEVDCMVSHR